jgi:hypothetical protein
MRVEVVVMLAAELPAVVVGASVLWAVSRLGPKATNQRLAFFGHT